MTGFLTSRLIWCGYLFESPRHPQHMIGHRIDGNLMRSKEYRIARARSLSVIHAPQNKYANQSLIS